MILWDGSRHEWLEERGPMLCLIGAIDDATGEVLPGAHFVDRECAAGYLRVLKAIAEDVMEDIKRRRVLDDRTPRAVAKS